MTGVISSVLAVLVIIYTVPFIIYGTLSAVGWVKKPKGAPVVFLLSVLVSKTGTAAGFVLLYYFSFHAFDGVWFLYAFLWWLMFIIGEVGQAIGPNYSWKEAVAGILSETVYFPLSAYLLNWLLK